MSDILFSKISGTVLNFKSGKRVDAGVHYSSRTMDLPNKRMSIETYVHGRWIHSELKLEGADELDFSIATDDPSIPVIQGRFLDNAYQESIINCTLTAQGISVAGSVTKLSERRAISIKLMYELETDVLFAVAQEQVDLISEEEFRAATK